jgi:hypothetical protein
MRVQELVAVDEMLCPMPSGDALVPVNPGMIDGVGTGALQSTGGNTHTHQKDVYADGVHRDALPR